MSSAASCQVVIDRQKLPIRNLARPLEVHTATVHIIAPKFCLLYKEVTFIHLLTMFEKQRGKSYLDFRTLPGASRQGVGHAQHVPLSPSNVFCS